MSNSCQEVSTETPRHIARLMADLCEVGKGDVALFKELGLIPFANVELHSEIHVGTVKISKTNKVDVFVSCLPAQSWRFVIETKEGDIHRKTILQTGSGGLQDYWSAIKLFAENMVTVKEFSRENNEYKDQRVA